MIRINLHDYRDELRKIEIQKQMVKCFTIVIVAIIFIITSWLMEQVKLDSIKSEIFKLESQVAGLTKQFQKVKAMEAKEKHFEDIISGIEGLREKQMPASTIVGDINLMVPEGIWLDSIIQRDLAWLEKRKIPVIMFNDPSKKKKKKRKKKNKSETDPKEFVEVSGYAQTEKGVGEYMKRLQKISYYKTTFLYKSSHMFMKGQSVHKFTIYCYMPKT